MATESLLAAPPVAAALTRRVEAVLTDFVTAEVAALRDLDPGLGPLAATARDAVLGGGKRIRPTFAYWGWRATSAPEAQVSAVLPALAALELMHAFALVHDDVMDRSATRRGRPSAHQAMQARHRRAGLRGDAERFGDAAAILVGDLCLVWADQLMAHSTVPPARLAAARLSYDRMRVEAIAGQFLDVLGGCTGAWSVARALRTARLKTAGYTVVRPLQYGAALGDGDPAALSGALTRYGFAVGEAFQLQDDLLGVFGHPDRTGKPVGDDLELGKPTVLLELARSLATSTQRTELERLVAVGDADALAALVADTGAAEAVRRMIGDRVADAEAALAAAALDPASREGLAALADAVAWRSG